MISRTDLEKRILLAATSFSAKHSILLKSDEIRCITKTRYAELGSRKLLGFQSSPDELIYTMPFRDTVAGDALSMFSGSKMILHVGDILSRSPLANVSVLLSSKTEFKFSIQILSTGPSSTNQTNSAGNNKSINDENHQGPTKHLLTFLHFQCFAP